MFDTVNFWIDRGNISGSNPFGVLPYLSEITERQNKKTGYSCTGKNGDYQINIAEYGISLKGSLAKNYLGNNIDTLTRHTAKQALEQLSDNLHIRLNMAKVTRFDFATVISATRPPSDYYSFLGQKTYFERVQFNLDTLYYNNSRNPNQATKQIIFYDKTKEAKSNKISMPEIFTNSNLFRYELRYKKRLNQQFKQVVTATTLTDEVFYRSIVQNWHNEFKTIQKLKNQNFMIDNVATIKDAETALFAFLLQQSGKSTIDDFLNELKAKNTFKDRQRYSELKRKLHKIMTASTEQKNDLIQELEKKIFTTAKYAM